MPSTLESTAYASSEEGGDDAEVRMALTPRATHVLQWLLQRAAIPRGGANPLKVVSVRLELELLDSMKLELLVIAHQHGVVNTFPGLVHTARQAMEVGGYPKSPLKSAEGKTSD